MIRMWVALVYFGIDSVIFNFVATNIAVKVVPLYPIRLNSKSNF